MTQGRFTNLDAFRGIAALLVLLFHTPFINGSKLSFLQSSDIFVDFFFILSGFVICHSYLKRIPQDYPFSAYLQNRFARIYPLHITLLLTWLIFFVFKELLLRHLNIANDSVFNSNDGYAFFLNLTLLNAHGLDDHLSWNAPAWSIGAEFYTYLLFFFVAKKTGSTQALLCSLIIVCCAYSFIYVNKPTTLLRTFDLGFIRALGGFFTGVVIYILSNKINFKVAQLDRSSMTTIEVFFIVAIYLSVTHLADTKNGQLVIYTLFALTIFSYANTQGLVTGLLNKVIFQQLGKLSYSIYLLHALVITVIANIWEFIAPSSVTFVGNLNAKMYQSNFAVIINLAIIAITFLLAIASYQFIERPLQKRLRSKLITK